MRQGKVYLSSPGSGRSDSGGGVRVHPGAAGYLACVSTATKHRFAKVGYAIFMLLVVLYLVMTVVALIRGDVFHLIWYFSASVVLGGVGLALRSLAR